MDYKKIEAQEAYKKFIRSSKSFLSLFDKKENLKKFEDVQKENKAFTGIYLGVKNVAIEKIVGSVQKYTDFDKNFVPLNKIIEARWCNIYIAYTSDEGLPLVQLYKIKDDYYVYDGNHRISVANYLKFSTIEAEVTEFLPSKDEKEEALYREKFIFEKEYGIGNLDFTEVYFFGRIRKEIKDFGSYLRKVEGIDNLSRPEKAKIWYSKLYKNAYRILELNNIQDFFQGKSLSDIYIYYLDHKYYESEKRGENIGYYEGLISFINTIKAHANKSLDNFISLDTESLELLKKVEDLDFRYNTKDIYKHDLLKEAFGEKNYKNYRLLDEINAFQLEKDLDNFLKALTQWKDQLFLDTIEQLKKRTNVLEETFIEILKELLSCEFELYFSIKDYEKIYNMKYKETNYGGVVNYILDIFIPVSTYFVKKKGISFNCSDYFGIFDKYLYLIRYNPNVSISKAIDLYYDEKTKKNYSFYDRVSNRSKIDIILDAIPNKFEIQNTPSFLFLNELMDRYGSPVNYANLIKIYEYIQVHLEKGLDITEVREKISNEVKKLYDDDDINSYYKTKYVLDKLSHSKTISFLDFYQKIIEKGSYFGENIISVDILKLANEYITQKN